MFGFFEKKTEVEEKTEERSVTVDTVDSIFSSSSSTSSVTNITTAYASIRLLANTVAMTKIKHLETTERGEEELKTSRLSSLLKNPQNNTSYFQWMQNMVNQVSGLGNSFSIVIRESGSPVDLIFVPESQVSIYTTLDENFPYYYQFNSYGRSFKLDPEDVIHFRNITEDGYTGLSPLSIHRMTFDAASSIANYNKTFMDNATNISGILSTDKKLTQQQ